MDKHHQRIDLGGICHFDNFIDNDQKNAEKSRASQTNEFPQSLIYQMTIVITINTTYTL